MQNGLNKPYMELEGNRTARNASIDAHTVLKENVFFFGGGGEEGCGGQNGNPMKPPMGNHLNKLYMEVEGNPTTKKTS